MLSIDKPYVLLVAEKIYLEICKIQKLNSNLSNIDLIENFIGTEVYKEISSGKFHDELFKKIELNNFENKKTKKKIPKETLKLLQIQKEVTIKQLIEFPELYYVKSQFPLEITQRAFDFLWRMCESYELWCKETKQNNLIKLNIID
jgi:hypothetical protein